MKAHVRKLALMSVLPAAAFALASCDVEKTQEGNMPEVEVKEEGRLPKYDVDAPEVDVTTETKEVEVPEVNVTPADQDAD